MSNLFFKKDVHKSIEALLYGLYVYQYLLDTSTFGLLLRCLVQEQIISIKSKAPTLRLALYIVIAAAFLAFLRHLHPPERYAVIIDFIGNASSPSQAIIYWLDTVILVLQVTEALIVFNVIKSQNFSEGSNVPTTTPITLPPPRVAPSSSNRSDRSNSRISDAGTSVNAGASRSGSSITVPILVNHSSASESSSSNLPPQYTQQQTTANTNGSSNRENTESLDDMYPEYYEDEEETRFSTDLERQQQSNQGSSSSSQPSRPLNNAARSNNTNNRERSSADDSDDHPSSESDDGDPLGDDYEEVLEQEAFVFQLRFKDLISYIFSRQEALTMPDARALAGSTADSGGQSGSTRVQQRELPV
ncbi:hypothetical protein FBU30_005254 [Linnemannia zychae]|nr:hypothetical protein FBU30_005254 [Linnemannia zychae]